MSVPLQNAMFMQCVQVILLEKSDQLSKQITYLNALVGLSGVLLYWCSSLFVGCKVKCNLDLLSWPTIFMPLRGDDRGPFFPQDQLGSLWQNHQVCVTSEIVMYPLMALVLCLVRLVISGIKYV